MAVNFPNNPNINDTFVSNGVTFKWDGNAWKLPASPGVKGLKGEKGETGQKGEKGQDLKRLNIKDFLTLPLKLLALNGE